MEPTERRLPDELRAIAARLHAERTQADPLQLDDIKRRVMARSSIISRRSISMKSKLATIATLLTLVGGTGGAIAVGATSSGNGYRYGASAAQYHKKQQKKKHKKHHKKHTKAAHAKRQRRGPAFTG